MEAVKERRSRPKKAKEKKEKNEDQSHLDTHRNSSPNPALSGANAITDSKVETETCDSNISKHIQNPTDEKHNTDNSQSVEGKNETDPSPCSARLNDETIKADADQPKEGKETKLVLDLGETEPDTDDIQRDLDSITNVILTEHSVTSDRNEGNGNIERETPDTYTDHSATSKSNTDTETIEGVSTGETLKEHSATSERNKDAVTIERETTGDVCEEKDGKLYPDISQQVKDLQLEMDKEQVAVNIGKPTVEEELSRIPRIQQQEQSKAPEVLSKAPEVPSKAPEVLSTTLEVLSKAPEVLSTTPEGISTAPEVLSTAPEVLSTAPEVLSTAPQEADLVHDEEDKLANQRAEEKKREAREAIQPLTVEQLNSLYHNERLEANAEFIKKFVETELKRESPEFYEILLNYQRARKHLLETEAALASLEQRYSDLEEEIWITETKTSTVKGTCGDNARCTKTIAYEQARLNETALGQLTKTLDSIKEEIQHNLCLHSYSSMLSKLQVESYLYTVIASSPAVYQLPRNVPVYVCERIGADVAQQASRLKMCISVLFYFHRTPIEDEEMLNNLQNWTERLVSPLLRIGTFEDHLFILNHILRCPAGIGSWATHYLQAPPIPDNEGGANTMFGNTCLDHVITALATILIPTSGRAEFLTQMQKVFTPHADKKQISWVMVDEDGEEDEDPQNAWLYLHENDIVAILRQFPIADIFRHVFFIVQCSYNDTYEYSVEKTMESTMYRLYAFCTCLVRLFGTGLKTYSMARYRQLNKRLGRMIRQTVQYMSDHWGNFRDSKQGQLPIETMRRLQLEFDSFFLRAVDFIHTAQRLGSWQFIADMPFKNISKDTMWKLLWLLYQSHGQSVDVVHIPPVKDCVTFVQDRGGLSQLADILQHVPATEGVYLLNTMTNMTQSCSSSDLDLIETVTMAVYEVSYICPQTRDSCSKMGRELLAVVVGCHPFILSKLIQLVHDSTDKLGSMGLYLFKGLPLDAWLPSDRDLSTLRHWLLNNPLGSHSHMLSQLILSNINWSKSQQKESLTATMRTIFQGNSLMVPWKVHKQVAILIVEAYQMFIMGKHLGSVIMEGVKQMSAAVQQYSTSEQEFNGWCWDLLIKLSLHRSSLPPADQRLAEAFHQEVLDLNKDDSLLPLVKGNKENNATACFVSLLLTKYGHSETEFLTQGIPLLQILVDQGLSKAIICVLNCVIPMFADIHAPLLENERFQAILYTLLQSDESYFKVVKGLLSYDFPGPITRLLTSMIMSQVNEGRSTNKDRMLQTIGLWVKLLMNQQHWYQDRNYCYVLDQLIGASFSHPPVMEGVLLIMQHFFKQFCDEERNQGVVSSFMSWVTSGTYLPSFLEKSSCPEFPWLAYMVLCLEGNYELDTKLWETIQAELITHLKMTIDQALKKAKNKLKLDQAPTYGQLSLYRFAQQALDMPVNHPVAVLTWQRFFVLFLGRLDTLAQTNSQQKGSVGEKFFSGMSYSSMRKKLKKRLKQTSDWYLKCTADTSCDTDEDRYKRDMYNRLARIYQTLELWVEEPLLHDQSLYLPSLPTQYMADRLMVVLQKNTTPWLEFIDTTEIEDSIISMAEEWRKSHVPDQTSYTQTDKRDMVVESGAERILSRLKRCEKPLPPPPVHPVKAPVPDVSPAILEDMTALLHLLQADLDLLKHHADYYSSQMSKQETLDEKFIRLAPLLYRNVPKEKVVSLECASLINPLHRCSKPGSAVMQFYEKESSPIEQRQVNENRVDYRQLMMKNKLPPPQNIVISAVHTENTITMLVKLYRSCTDERKLRNINSIACTLFFRLGETINKNVQNYPPTQQFFSSCLDVLGQNFIQKDPNQTEPLLQMAVKRPELGGFLSPHFVPNISHKVFANMYNMLLKTLERKQLELTFMLLTKFDVKKWLSMYSPNKQEVKKFVETMGQAFCMCGVEPDETHTLVFGLYIGHEKMVLQNRFPLNIYEVLSVLLQGSSSNKTSITCWTTFHSICFYGNSSDESATSTESQMYPNVFTDLSTEQITNLIHWLGNEFMQTRLNEKAAASFGLYPKWKSYVGSLAEILRDLSKCLVDKMIPTLREATTNESIESLWRCIVEGFGPWLQVIYVSKVAGMPWIDPDRDTAMLMVKALREVVGFAHFRTLEVRGKFYNDFLSMLWLYFATTLCKADVAPYVISAFNYEFQQLPWKQLCPNIQVMDTLCQLKQYGGSMGFNLVTDIVSMIDWPQVRAWYKQYHSTETNSKFEGFLFLLLVQACAEKKYMENPDMENLLSQAESYKWQTLSPDIYKKSCSLFLHDSDSKCILVGRTSQEGLGLRLLKSASGFTTEVSQLLTEDWCSKRLCYLHTVSSLICQCTFQADWQPAPLKTLIVNLLTEIETVESAVLDPYTQTQECTDMVKEILTLLNNCNPDNQGSEVVMETWLEWLQDSPQTILLSPCIHAATRNVASLTSMVRIVELCIELTFVPGRQQKMADPWNRVLSAMQFPELNIKDFFNTCLQESAFLLLHCYVLERLPLCQSLTEEQGLIETILDWMEKTKPSADNESKLILWWYKVLELILRQMDFGGDNSMCVTFLRKFAQKIQIFGEDRMSGGLLGAIGLGKKSLLTEKFRLCCKAVIAFISQQIIGDNELRVGSSSPTSNLPAAKQDVATLLSLKTNKRYQPIKIEVETLCDYVMDQSKCLSHVLLLVKTLRTCFYSDIAYLAEIDTFNTM